MVLPNQLTTLRIILSPVFVYLFLSEDPTLKQISLVVYIVAALTDWYDGWLARKFNYITTWGKFLDPLADKVLTSSAFIAFAYLDVIPVWMVVVIVVRDFLITGLRSYAEFKKISFTTSRIAKIKTFAQMTYIYYLLVVYTFITIDFIFIGNEDIFKILTNEYIIYYGMFIVTFFTFYTGLTYLITNRKLIKKLFSFETSANS